MCIGLPLQVIESWPGGALAAARGEQRRVDTRLVGGAVSRGEWLLVFQDAARERLDAARAHEILATLALVEAAMRGDAGGATADAGFVLPSSLDPREFAGIAAPRDGGRTS